MGYVPVSQTLITADEHGTFLSVGYLIENIIE